MGKMRKNGQRPQRNPRTSFRAMLDKWLEEDREFRWDFEEEDLKLNLAEEIDKAREALGITQQELADYCQTTQSAVSRFLKGQDTRSPRLDTLVKLADAVGKKLAFRLEDRMAKVDLAPVVLLPLENWNPSSSDASAAEPWEQEGEEVLALAG